MPSLGYENFFRAAMRAATSDYSGIRHSFVVTLSPSHFIPANLSLTSPSSTSTSNLRIPQVCYAPPMSGVADSSPNMPHRLVFAIPAYPFILA